MRITVLGGGSWGTTLANLLAQKDHTVSLWVRDEEQACEIQQSHVNKRYLPEISLCQSLGVTSHMALAMKDAQCIVVAVPSQHIREMLVSARSLFPNNAVVVCASKGLENGTLQPMSQVIAEALGDLSPQYAMLSGPSFAKEVSLKLPTAIALGCEDRALARRIQDMFSTDFFRVYTTTDYKGVELGGAVKNVMAIAAGIADGLGCGHDTRAALITRGLAEMSRLGTTMGADARTFMGLSGMGDLVLTCTGDLSRNRQVGLLLGQGKTLDDILSGMHMVAEGVKTTRSVHDLGKAHGIELPITQQVYKVLYEHKEPQKAVRELMRRSLKDE